MTELHQGVQALSPQVLTGLQRGIEKEGLRIDPDGTLARSPHPDGLGAALTHPNITTDFSEAQLELITGVHSDIDACLRELTELHQVVYRRIGDEMLWCATFSSIRLREYFRVISILLTSEIESNRLLIFLVKNSSVIFFRENSAKTLS